ncbi:MAG: two-component regulator propeller domain-containing protein [Wenzhouxiangella sp.]
MVDGSGGVQGGGQRGLKRESCLRERCVNSMVRALSAALLVMLAGSSSALAPDKAFHQYVKNAWSIEQGLPQITVNALVQGPRGYIWVGTQAGVARFDGVRFAVFDPSNTPALPGVFIRDLFFDSRDRLWVGTYKGAALREAERFETVPDDFGSDIDVFQFAETGNGEILAATSRGLLRLRDGSLVQADGDPREPVRSVHFHAGRLLVGGYGEILSHDGNRWRVRRLTGELASALVSGFAFYDGTYWAATSKGLLYLDDGVWRRHPLGREPDDHVIEVLYPDGDGNFWIGAAGRLLRLQGRELVEVVDDDDANAHASVLSITEDHEGNLWMGSRWDGLARLWNGWVFRYDRPEGLHNSLVWSVARDENGNIWTGTLDGLAVFRDGRFEQVTRGKDQPHPHAYTLLPENDRVWVGTRTGLFIWDRERGEIVRPEAFSPLDRAQINGIVRRADGSYWLATTDGVWRWDGESMERMVERDEPGGQDARVLLNTGAGELYLGTRRGLLKLDDDSRFRRVTGVSEEHDVTSLIELSDGRIVAGTLNERMWVKVSDDRWLEFGEEHGLPANSPWAFGEHDGTLWVGGIRGIHELELAAIDQWIAGAIDRLPGRMVLHERGDVPGAQKGFCCNGAGNAKGFMHDGEFWLPTRGGVVHLVPERIERNPQPPQLAIDRVRIDGRWRLVDPDERLELSPDQRDIAFGFSVLSYQDPGSVQVRYRLKGFSDRWQELDDSMQRQAFYTNLPAGTYTLEVEGSNNAGVWSPEPVGLELSIRPKIWETAIFQAVLLFVVLTLIWLAVNYRVGRLQRQQRVLEQTIAERTEELRVANENLRDYSSRMETVTLTDPLTGLWNRRYLMQQLPSDLAHFHRELVRDADAGPVMLFAVFNIDQLRRITQRHGHASGNEVLGQVGELLRDLVRQGDYVARWSGEAFLLVFRPMPPAEPPKIAERINEAVRRRRFRLPADEEVRLTASLGLAEYPPYRDQPGAFSWMDTVTLAERAVEHARLHGGDTWCLARPTPWIEPAALIDRLDLDLQTLLEAEQVSVRTGRDR